MLRPCQDLPCSLPCWGALPRLAIPSATHLPPPSILTCTPSALLPPTPAPHAESETDRQRRAEWQPGKYVRVHGHISSFGKSQEVIAFNVRPVADFNEASGGL